MMATRAGSVDPGLLLYLLTHGYLDAGELEQTLCYDSGLKGASGIAEDIRAVVAATRQGDQRAGMAFDLYSARIREGIGAMGVAMNGLYGLVFTGGVGEHSADVPAAVCRPLGWLGVAMDDQANVRATPDEDVATAGLLVRILVVQTREELMIARETRQLLSS